jgi:hypothetical protein
MNNVNTEAISEANQETYDRLIVSLEAGIGSLQIFIAVCDGDIQRAEIIHRYEQELAPNIKSYQVYLDPQEPSLRKAVADAISSHENTIVTVLGAEALGFFEQDESLKKFFGYLQWTREALRELHLPIILWVPEHILKLISKKSPDFWSWCNGVFQFTVESKIVYNKVLQKERIRLQSYLESRYDFLSRLRMAIMIEIELVQKFRLEHEIDSMESEIKKLENRLDEIEQVL